MAQISNIEYKQLTKRLRKSLFGNYTRAAELAGVEVSTVTRVLDGYWRNDEVVAACVQAEAEAKREQAEKVKQFKTVKA